ncbi:MAG: non-ribosomal peptide synthetase [Sphingomonas sp.]
MNEMTNAADLRRQLMERMLRGEANPAAEKLPDPIVPRDPARVLPLTREQNQLWLHAQMAPEMPLYNESITIHRYGAYDHRALEMALTEIVRRHEIWRTSFHDDDGNVTQRIAPPFEVKLPLLDITDMPADEREAEAHRLATADAKAPIDFTRAPMFRARVIKVSDDEHRLYLTLHHIIFDGVSIYRTLVPELAALVKAFEAGQPSPLAEPAIQYADYAAWQQDQADPETLERQLDYWRTALAQPLPRLEIAGDRPRPGMPTHAGSMEVFELADDLVAGLKALARAENATLYMVLLAAYKAMLYRYTGDTDIIVGGVTDTRRRPELQPLIGYFLNTMALRSKPAGDQPFRAYLAEVKASVIGALGASDIPFDRLMRSLGIKRGKGTHPLFNTLFSIEPPVDPFPEGWDLTQMDVVVGAAKYDLYLELDERPSGMDGRFLYSTELFDPATIRRMIAHWTRMLEGIAASPDTPLGRLPMLSADEQTELVDRWNDTAEPLPYSNVVDWFVEQAAKRPDQTALTYDNERWTYADLARRSDTIAARLVTEGVAPGALVGLSLGRSPWMVAAMLGVAKAGAAYLPLDPGFPPSRLALIAEDAGLALVLVESGTEHAIPAGIAPALSLTRDWPDTAFEPRAIDGESLAYVLYTSGSTGKPKGVEIPHAALVNLLMAMQQAPGFAEGETLLAITTLSFDIAELELWLPLVTGGTVVIASRDEAMDMAALIARIDKAQPQVMQATPATWRGLIETGWTGRQTMRVLCGGEALPRALADQLLPLVGELWNMYGPTETTIWSTVSKVSTEGPIAIGKPIANTQVRILDNDGNDRPVGAIGELMIGGRGLAVGYRGRPDLTEQRFVEHAGARLYRTGDLGRWRADGVLECLGRTDNEVKIRGFRIAIEEVEGALAKLPGATGAAARAWPDPSGEHMLAGYVVGGGDPACWRDELAKTLPDYMIPTRFVQMDELPLTPNGKVDRKQLPEPGAQARRAGEPPKTPQERQLAEIWCAVLKVDAISRDDDFFDLGGHSLLIARLIRRIQADYGIRLPMGALFQAPKLAEMAELLASGTAAEASPIVPIQPHGSRPPILWLDGGSTFMPLSEQLGLDQPFYGVHVDAILEKAGGCPKTLEEAARLVVATLRQERPHGPYFLGGWCTSGILAYAVADEFNRQGCDVPLLMLVHAFHPVRSREIGHVRAFFSKVRFHLAHTMRQPRGERLRYFFERLRTLSDAANLRGGREAVLAPKLRAQLERAGYRYTPPPYAGATVLMEPADHPDVLDFAGDWRASCTGEFTAHIVPGGHRTMLEQPDVETFAAMLRPHLDRAMAVEPLRKAS